MDDERLDELIALAATGELTEHEERELDELLASDAGAVSELRSTLDAAAAVQSTLAEPPPPALRDRVMARTAGMPQASATPPAAPTSTTNVVDLASRRRRRVMSFVAAAAAAIVLVVGGAVIVTNDRGGGDQIEAVRRADDVQTRTLTGELAGLSVLYSPSERALLVDGVNVRTPNGTNDFELWLVGADGAIPVGVFRPGDDGRVEQRFDDVDPTGFVLGVTEEPAGGSEQPTLPILASA